MAPIRTLVVTLSPLLRDMVTRALLPHACLEIIRTLASREALAVCLRDCAPDLVLIGLLPGEDDTEARQLLASVSSACVLALTAKADRAWVSMPPRDCIALADLSLSGLVEALAPIAAPPPQG